MMRRLLTVILVLAVQPAAAEVAIIKLPATAQMGCWDTVGAVIDCNGTGQDGESRTGASWPVPRFVDNGNGTLTDKLTELVWLKNANCFGSIGWQQALDAAKVLSDGACGLGDGSTAGQWRVPNRKELLNITSQNESNGGTWLTSQGFTNGLHTYYWTSDTCLAYSQAYKWIVHSVGAAYPDNWNLPGGSRTVMLVRDPFTYAIATSVSGSGSIACTPSGPVTRGSDATCRALPGIGSHLTAVTVDGADQAVPDPLGLTYTFTAVTADHAMTASFALDSYTVTFSAGANGTISDPTPQTVTYGGSTPSVAALPDPGYRFLNWTGANGFTSTENPLSVTNVASDLNLTANFVLSTYNVTPAVTANGSILPALPQQVSEGGSLAFTLVPDAGHQLASVSGCGGTLNGTVYTTGPVTSDCSVEASFIPLTFAIVTEVSGNGTILCSQQAPVAYGASVDCSILPGIGSHITSVTVDGAEQMVADPTSYTYSLQGISADHALRAGFALNSYSVTFAAGANGDVDGTTTQYILYGGGTTAVTAVPQTGYHFVNWTSSNGLTSMDNPLTITSVAADKALVANFTIDTYTVIPSSSENGILEPSAPVTVSYGSVASFTVTPAPGYRTLDVTGCGGSLAGTTYTTAAITAGCAVTATFAPLPPPVYNVSGTSTDDRGSITCSGEVVSGGAATCTISPRPGFELATLTDNGVDCLSLAAGGEYRIHSVSGNHAVVAGFAANSYPMEEIVTAYRSIVAGVELPAGETTRCDIAPLGLDGRPAPDGVVDVADLVILLRKLVGVVNW